MTSTQGLLTEQFYNWEVRGRGWMVAPHPVLPEPPFHPFFSHRIKQGYIDDGKKETLLSSLTGMFKKGTSTPTITKDESAQFELFPDRTEQSLIVFSVTLAKGTSIKTERIEQLLFMIGQSRQPVSFEIIGTSENITLQFVVRQQDQHYIYAQLTAYLPECSIRENDDYLFLYEESLCVVDLGLREEFMRPLSFSLSGERDPYIGLFGVLEQLEDEEHIVLQVLFSGTANNWTESIMRSVTLDGKESFFANAPEMPSLAEKKVSVPLYGVCIRMMSQSDTLDRAEALISNAATTLIAATSSPHNSLIELSHVYDTYDHLNDILNRRSRRFGMLLNLHELATFVHIPSAGIKSAKLYVRTNTKAVLPQYTNHPYLLGVNTHHGVQLPVCLSDEQRLSHVHIIGATGVGKSTLLHFLILQDIMRGNGIAVLDPHGDLIENILSFIPKERMQDVLVIDPSDSDYSIPFNLLNAHSDIEKDVLASDLVTLFRRFSSSWGDQMNSVFANAILAFLESTKGGTLIDLRRFLIEKPFRNQFLATVQDEAIRYYWQKEYPLLKGSAIASILTRLDTFLRPKPIRNMVSQRASIDFEHLMDTKKIILVKLPQGLIGTENSYLLGACIVAKIQQAAMARQAKAKADRTNFFLYIDEFHHFVTPSLSNILSGTRKYHVGLVVAHQDMQQVSKHDTELASAIIGNAGTRIVFRLGDTDAKKFAEGFTSFTAEDIRNLDRGEAFVRIGRAEHDCNLEVIPVPDTAKQHLAEQVIASSRKAFATPVAELPPIMEPANIGGLVNPDIVITPISILPQSVTLPEPTKEAEPAKPPEALHAVPEETQQDTISQLEKRLEQRQHRSLQMLVKKLAEDRGYKAVIEQMVLDGKGQVDVSLERDGKRIAVEISVSTSAPWELHNIQKCLGAGYDTVIACSPNATTLKQLREAVSKSCSTAEQQKIVYTSPDDVAQYLPMEETKNTAPEEIRSKGYRVQVSYGDIDPTEQQQKNMAIARIVRDAIKKE